MPMEKFMYENKVYTTEYIDGSEVVATDEKGRTYRFRYTVYVNPVM
jgi:hypothetical protein